VNTATASQPDAPRAVRTGDDRWGRAHRKPLAPRLRTLGVRRSVPHLLVGVLLVLACVGGFVLITVDSGDRQAVLVLARAVSVGHVLTTHDLRHLFLGVAPGATVVHAEQAHTVVGRPMATSLPAGTILTPDAVGAAAVPMVGHAITALALNPGQVPAEVEPGARVSVVHVPDQAGPATSPSTDEGAAWPAVVTSVTNPPNQQTTLVSVQLTETAAHQLAAVPAGQVAIVMLPPDGE
jgi:hypothetical protein